MNVYKELSDLVSKVMELECSDNFKRYMKDNGQNKSWTSWVKNAQKLKDELENLPNDTPIKSVKKRASTKETSDSDETEFEDDDIVDSDTGSISEKDSDTESTFEDDNLLAEPEPKKVAAKKAPAKKAPAKKETETKAKKAPAKKASAKKETKETDTTEKKPRGFMIPKMIKPDVAEFFDIEHKQYNQTELVEVVAKYSSTYLAKDGSKNIQLNDELKEHLNITDNIDELPRKDIRKYIKNLYV